MSQLTAISVLKDLPLGDVAELLGLPRSAATSVLAALAQVGGLSSAERRAALSQIERLRIQLRQVELTKDHSLLGRLFDFIVAIASAVIIAIAATPVGAIAVGDSVVKEIVKAGLIALVAMVLQYAVDGIRGGR